MSITELHKKMGHINHNDLRDMVRKGLVTGIELDTNSKPEFCETCIKSKATRKPFPKASTTEYTSYGDKIVSDVWGPAAVESLGGKKYAVTYRDLYSREERADYLRQKSETLTSYKQHEAWTKVQRNAPIKIFGCDRGGEYTSNEFSEHLKNAGTVRHLTVHDSPASNGVAERSNRTLVEGTRALLQGSGLPRNLWAEAH
jgi:transposase InsO family protein